MSSLGLGVSCLGLGSSCSGHIMMEEMGGVGGGGACSCQLRKLRQPRVQQPRVLAEQRVQTTGRVAQEGGEGRSLRSRGRGTAGRRGRGAGPGGRGLQGEPPV